MLTVRDVAASGYRSLRSIRLTSQRPTTPETAVHHALSAWSGRMRRRDPGSDRIIAPPILSAWRW